MMMDDRYLYRAKRVDNGEWVEGFYFCMTYLDGRHTHHFIIPLGADLILGTPVEKIQVEVDPDTICKCTGLKDKNGKLIWENDIVDFLGYKGTIKFECGSFGIGYRKNIDWKEIQANIMRVTGCENILYACENDNYISLWEIYWNFNDEDDSLNIVEVIGNTFDKPELDKYKNMEDCENYYDDEQEWNS